MLLKFPTTPYQFETAQYYRLLPNPPSTAATPPPSDKRRRTSSIQIGAKHHAILMHAQVTNYAKMHDFKTMPSACAVIQPIV